jgi:hypothetical protein
MQKLARLAMRGPLAAAGAIAVTALVSLLFAPSLLLSGALLALVTLRHGPLAGLRAFAVAAAICAALVVVVSGRLNLAAWAIGAAWLPALGSALTLRLTGQQGPALTSIGIYVTACAALMRLANPDVDGLWRERLALLDQMIEAEGGRFLDDAQVALYGGLMHTALLTLMFTGFAAMLLLGRSWQAGLYNPGGFRQEFHALALPRWLSPLGALVALSALFFAQPAHGGGLLQDAVVIFVMMFSVQGLAVLHASYAMRALGRGWLVGTYVLLGFVPQFVMPILATTGIADMVIDFRRRLRERAGS